jgi:dipeptidase D
MSFILDMEPKLVWKHFDEIRKIPRCSKHEEKIRKYVVDFALSKGLEHKVDPAGNVVIRKPGTKGMEHRPIVVLQGHMDMVCEKNSDKVHDFSKDPITLKRDGDWLTADGTTLGADNGIGIAMGLAVLEQDGAAHGPLEVLCTVDEETGLTGAFALPEDMVKGRIMLNIDSEEMGEIFVGCAGGGDSVITMKVRAKKRPKGYDMLDIKVAGLRGGHSGVDIHEQRGNAIKVLARAVHEATAGNKYYIGDIKGGNLRNAIPREAFVTLGVKDKLKENVIEGLKASVAAIREEIKAIDKDLYIEVEEVKKKGSKKVLNSATSRKVIDLLVALPHGVQAMSFDMPGLVETSCNLAVVGLDRKGLRIQMSSRSSIKSALNSMREWITTVAGMAGATVENPPAYPGWKPNLGSNILKLARTVFKEVTGKEPALKAIHAGLETGIIGEKFPGMDMISIGPDLKYPHSPEERIHMGTVGDLYKVLLRLLEKV